MIKKLFEKIGWDKLIHFCVSALMFVVLYQLTGVVGASAMFVFMCGFVKEGLDATEEGNFFSWADLIADVLGISFAYVVMTLI